MLSLLSFCPFVPDCTDILFSPYFIEKRDGGKNKKRLLMEGHRRGGGVGASTGHLAVAFAAFSYDKSIADNQ
jgi:hypothetical protein